MMVPEKIRIGSLEYRVIRAKQEEKLDDFPDGWLGIHDYSSLELWLAEDVPGDLAPYILLHEVLHAALDYLGIQVDREEELVTGLSHLLVDVLRNNRDLVTFLIGGA